MTTEQKAKAYDEAIKKAKKLYEQGTITESLNYVFPELKESNDERIRKALLELVHDTTGDELWVDYNVHKEDALAWLERQDEKPEHKEYPNEDEEKPNGGIVLEDFNEGDGFYKVNLAYLSKEQVEEIESLVTKWNQKVTDETIRNCIGVCLTDVSEQRFRDYNTSLKECLDWLNRQRDKDRLIKELGEYKVKYTQEVLSRLEKQGEQKPIDKVEPKFNVGDWIILKENHNSIYQVERIGNYRYHLRHYLGGALSVYFDSELIRQWTINDAKNGDVLVCEDFGYTSLMLFKSLSNGRISLHCWYNSQTNNFHINTDVTLRKDANIYPATKEQRDLLFQKMHDAGYEWDAEKKELKIIEKQGEQKTDEWKEGNIIKRCNILALVIKGRRAMKSNGEIFTIQYPYEWVKAKPNEIEYFFNEFEKQSKQHKSEENGLSGCKVQ